MPRQQKMPPESRPRPRDIVSRVARRLFGQRGETTGPYGGPDLPTAAVDRRDGSVVVTVPRRMLAGSDGSTGPTVPPEPVVAVTGDDETMIVTVPDRMVSGGPFSLRFPDSRQLRVSPDTGDVAPVTPDDLPTTQPGAAARADPVAAVPRGRWGGTFGRYLGRPLGRTAPRPTGPGYDPRVANTVIDVPIAPDDAVGPVGGPVGNPIDPGQPSK